MKFSLPLLLCLLIPLLSRAQEDEFEHILLSEEHNTARLNASISPDKMYEFAMEYPHVQGQPYLEKDWQKGSLFLNDGDTLYDIAFRYNIYEDLLEVRLKGKLINLNEKQVVGFAFWDPQTGEERFFRNGFKINPIKTSKEEEVNSSSYMEVMYKSENVVVLRHWRKTIQKSENTTNVPGLGQSTVSYSFSYPREEAFIIKQGLFVPVKLNKKGFLEAFLDERPLVNKYIKDHWLRCRSTEELVQVAKFYNKLLIRREERKAEREQQG